MTEQATANETTGRLRQLAEKHYARGVEIRHHLHPELSGQETKTARYVAEILRECGIETQTGIGGNGVLGVIRGGKPGKAVLLRADMDALAVDEQADVPYKSLVPGVMHACGHDGHTARLLGRGYGAQRATGRNLRHRQVRVPARGGKRRRREADA